MPSPETVIETLVKQVRERAGQPDVASLRAAWEAVLAELDVSPDDLSAWRDGADVLGSAYQRLFTGAERRDLGQFYTPFWAGEVMAGWLLEEKRKLVLDPGVGSGALSIPVGQHRRRGKARILGVDLDPLAVQMAERNAAIRGIDGLEARELNFLLDDLGERPDAVTCNPPYSRHHVIPAEQKAAIHDDFEARLGLRLSRLAGLHVLFLVRGLELTTPDARLAFITPSDWLDVNYGRKVKDYLLTHANVEALILFESGHLFFEGVLTTAAITLIKKGEPTGETKVLRLGQELPSPDEVLAALRTEGDMGVVRTQLAADEKWARPKAKKRTGTRLGDVARIRRGIATGANGFFVLSEAKRRELGIPREQLKPCLTSPKSVVGSEVTLKTLDALPDDVGRWLIDCQDEQAIGDGTPLGDYLKQGLDEKVNEGYLASRRKPWCSQETRGACPIVFTYFNRERPRFIRNKAEALPLNNWLIVEPKDGADADELFTALTSKAFIERLEDERRVYGGGLWKLEPKELAAVKLPRRSFRG